MAEGGKMKKAMLAYYVLAAIGLSIVVGQFFGLAFDYTKAEVKRIHTTEQEVELMRQDTEKMRKQVHEILNLIAH